MTVRLAALAAASFAFVVGTCSRADAGMISFIAQLQTNTGQFQISNLSGNGLQVSALSFALGDNAMFDLDVRPLSVSGVTDTGAMLAFSPGLSTAVIDGASAASFSFSGFDPNDAFGFTTGFVDAGGALAMGADLQNSLLSVTFSNGQTLMATFHNSPTPTSDQQFFFFSANAAVVPLATPEPGSAVLLLLGIIGIGGAGFGRRWKQRVHRPSRFDAST